MTVPRTPDQVEVLTKDNGGYKVKEKIIACVTQHVLSAGTNKYKGGQLELSLHISDMLKGFDTVFSFPADTGQTYSQKRSIMPVILGSKDRMAESDSFWLKIRFFHACSCRSIRVKVLGVLWTMAR